MKNLQNLYIDCRSYIGLNPIGMTSSESAVLYEFIEQYAIQDKVFPEVIEAAEKVIQKYQEFQIQV